MGCEFIPLSLSLSSLLCLSVCLSVCVDLWKSPEFLEKYRRFVDCLPPAEFRVECMACSLISASDNSLLMTKERDGQLRHNEYLIGHLKIGGTDSFRLFCKVLRKMGSMFEPDAKAMEDVAQRHTNPEL